MKSRPLSVLAAAAAALGLTLGLGSAAGATTQPKLSLMMPPGKVTVTPGTTATIRFNLESPQALTADLHTVNLAPKANGTLASTTRSPWGLTESVSPATIRLKPGRIATATLTVTVPKGAPAEIALAGVSATTVAAPKTGIGGSISIVGVAQLRTPGVLHAKLAAHWSGPSGLIISFSRPPAPRLVLDDHGPSPTTAAVTLGKVHQSLLLFPGVPRDATTAVDPSNFPFTASVRTVALVNWPASARRIQGVTSTESYTWVSAWWLVIGGAMLITVVGILATAFKRRRRPRVA
jgi:hypothetical protein